MAVESTVRPLISIVVPAYNAADGIEESLSSLRAQTYDNLEIIVVDDGSTDETPSIVRGLARCDPRILLVEQANQYAGVARNNGLRHAHGKYVLFLDADDMFVASMVEMLVARAEEAGADVTVCRSEGVDIISGESCPLGASLHDRDFSEVRSGFELKDEMFSFCGGWAWDKLYRTDFVREQHLSFQATRTSNDACFVFTSLMVAERIAFVGEVLVRHRVNNAASLEGSRDRSYRCALEAVEAIGREMDERGLREDFGRCFDNWKVTFLLWNYSTLSEGPRRDLLKSVIAELVPSMPDAGDDGYYRHALERSVAGLWHRGDYLSLMDAAMSVALEGQELRSELAAQRVVARDACQRVVDLEREVQQIRDSTSFRVGSMLTWLPRVVKRCARR